MWKVYFCTEMVCFCTFGDFDILSWMHDEQETLSKKVIS